MGQFSLPCTSAVTSDLCTHCCLLIIVTSIWVFYLLLQHVSLVNVETVSATLALEMLPITIFMPLIFENTNPIQDYVCTFSVCQKPALKNHLRRLWDMRVCITRLTNSRQQRLEKYMCIWLINMKLYGIISINGTLQGDKFLPWLFTSWIWSFWGSPVTLLSCVSVYVAVLLCCFLLSLTVRQMFS